MKSRVAECTMVYNKWIYENTADNMARFVLGEKGGNPLVCFGINSSTAEPNKLDPTLTRVRNQSVAKEFDGWVMLNLYPQRATNPEDMHKELDKAFHNRNLKCIKRLFLDYPNATAWAAWGGNIMRRAYLLLCLREIAALVPRSIKWVRKGNLVGGIHPHHPLYLPNDLPFAPFNMSEYLDVVG